MRTTRRSFLRLVGAGAAAATVRLDAPPAFAQAGHPVKLGVLTIRAGIAAPVGAAGLRGTEWWLERVNRAGGILGRPVQLVVEEESNPKDTVERYRKLVLQDRVDAVLGGISTGVTLALGPVAEDLGTPWLSWDGTTQKGVEETMPNPRWAFKSVDNEVEAIVAGMLTPRYFRGIKTVAGIGNDYSYGHDCWQSYQTVLKRYVPDVKFVLELFPRLGVTDFTSHIAAIQQSKADLLMCSFWSGDATIIMKQAAAGGTTWPERAAVVRALEGIEVESLSGRRSWRQDHVQMCNFYQGITTHRNSNDFVTIDPVEVVSTKVAMKPAGTKLFDWINSWKI